MSLLDLSAQFSQKTLNELYNTKDYDFLVSAATIGVHAPPKPLMPFPVNAADAKHQKTADGVLNDLPMPPPTLSVANFTVRSADMDALHKPSPVGRLPTFLPDPTVKAMVNQYEQEMERQNQFFAGYEEAKREGQERRRAYLRIKGFAEAEIDEIMKETRKREGVKALDEGIKYTPGGDLTFQHDVRRMFERVPEAPRSEGRADVPNRVPTVDPTTVPLAAEPIKVKPSDILRYEATTAVMPTTSAGTGRPMGRGHPFPIVTPEGELGHAIKIKRIKPSVVDSAAAPMLSPTGGSAV